MGCRPWGCTESRLKRLSHSSSMYLQIIIIICIQNMSVIHVQIHINTHISMATSLSKIFCDFIQVIFLGGLISISPEYFGRSKL